MKNYDFCGLTGDVILRNNICYNHLRQEWNRSIQKYPLVIVYCYENKDIKNALCWSIKNNVEIRLRSGGHNYEGYSIGNYVLVIDISKMNNIYINEEKRMVKVQGGVKNYHLYNFLGSRGYPFPGGSCPTVGVAGYELGGGWGFSSKLFGLGCDSLVEIEIMNYKGNIIKANESCNSDLFWACRGGGGGNFGVVLSMTFSLPKKVKKVTLLSIYYPNSTLEEQVDIFDTLQNMFPTLDRRMNFRIGFYNSLEEGKAVYLIGLFYGSEKGAIKIIEPLKIISPNAQVTRQYITFLEATQEIAKIYPPYEKFKSTGGFVFNKYTRSEIYKILNFISKRPKGSVFTSVSLYGLGGAVNDVGKKDTAFYYRGCQYILGIQTVWEDNKYASINKAWFKEQFDIMSKFFTGSYVNFPYEGIKNYEKRYYGCNIYRLKLIKSKYDPFNIFRFPQSINPFKKPCHYTKF